jgi:YbbR domain-containing protein
MRRLEVIARRLVVENAGIKLVAILSALALFFIAREETIREVEIDVPVVVSAYPKDRVLLSQPPSVIRVRVRGNLQKLTDVLARRTPYELDLSGYGTSQTAYIQLDTIEDHLGEGVKVLSISPSRFEVDLDMMETRRVPVAVDIIKGPGPYWRVAQERMEVTPRFVDITGPSTMLDTIRQIHTEPLDLSNITRDFSGKVALEQRPDIKAKPNSVQLSIPITEKDGEKLLRGAKIVVRNCPEGFLCEAAPVFFQARIQGRERIVDMITAENLSRYVYVDASKLPIEKELLQKHFPAVEPVVEPLKEATISLPKVRYFNITVTRK